MVSLQVWNRRWTSWSCHKPLISAEKCFEQPDSLELQRQRPKHESIHHPAFLHRRASHVNDRLHQRSHEWILIWKRKPGESEPQSFLIPPRLGIWSWVTNLEVGRRCCTSWLRYCPPTSFCLFLHTDKAK